MPPTRIEAVNTSTLAPFLFLFLSLFAARASTSQSMYVAAIVDGERLLLSDGSRIELIGVDTIEKFSRASIDKDMLRWGIDAESVRTKSNVVSAYMTTLLKSRHVGVSIEGGGLDSLQGENTYEPAFLFVLDEAGRLDFLLNRKMIEDGYAVADPLAPESIRDGFVKIQEQAMLDRRGLWAVAEQVNSEVFPGQIHGSENTNLDSTCRLMRACQWVSGENLAVGFWKSAPGYKCPCASN